MKAQAPLCYPKTSIFPLQQKGDYRGFVLSPLCYHLVNTMSKAYNKYLQSDDWKNKRKTKYRRARNRKCAICMSWKNLHVHHLIYKPNLADVKNSDLRVLCETCHKATHDLINSGVIKFRSDKHNSRFATIKNHVKKHLKLYPDKEERKQRRKERDKHLQSKNRRTRKLFVVKHPEITQILTDEIINRGMSKNGGWSLKQLRLFGFTKFTKGWKWMVVGQEFPRELIIQFLYLKNKHLK